MRPKTYAEILTEGRELFRAVRSETLHGPLPDATVWRLVEYATLIEHRADAFERALETIATMPHGATGNPAVTAAQNALGNVRREARDGR